MHLARSCSVLALAALAALAGGCASGTPGTAPAQIPAAAQRAVQSLASLGAYNVDKTKTTVAGISSGGFMAVQLHVAFSSTFHYAAIYAGGPYYCAQNSLSTAQTTCQYATASSLSASESYLDSQSSAGTIDNKSNLNGQKAYLWSGTSDYTVEQKTMNDLELGIRPLRRARPSTTTATRPGTAGSRSTARWRAAPRPART